MNTNMTGIRCFKKMHPCAWDKSSLSVERVISLHKVSTQCEREA